MGRDYCDHLAMRQVVKSVIQYNRDGATNAT
jgi:hypothetical protein